MWLLQYLFYSFRSTQPLSQEKSSSEDYHFTEEPSDDFFCPVTYGLLLQPHLTSCCGKHLSEEAATRIQREKGVCPLCQDSSWTTMLNKHFQRQVTSLQVFCRYEDRGCRWQGEITVFQPHVEYCSAKDAPKMPLSVMEGILAQ